jgi:hypothetical protein
VEVVIRRVPVPVTGSLHRFKYRLALVSEGLCVMRYDDEAGKEDHKHLGTPGGPLPVRPHRHSAFLTDVEAHSEAMRWLGVDSYAALAEVVRTNGRQMPGHRAGAVTAETRALLRSVARPVSAFTPRS